MFPSYIENPSNICFEGQDQDETILLLLRAHPITNLKWIIPAVLIFLFPFFIPTVLVNLEVDGLLNLPSTYLIIFIVINYLLVLVISFEGFLYWYFNVYIVTSKNLVDVDFHSILFKNIDLAPIKNVEDTSSSMGGILKSIFNYGDVFVQTAGAVKSIDFLSVPNPHRVSDFILDQTHKLGGT
ncbi:MAG: Uncharacterized protein CEO21_235 [Microgenomates group bacterium Gr01-1014_80]|nr:MAG: Uncharacterized protein CEO21_235 [Microgenomates group bacterium Gr01-1014_80]